MYHTILQCTTLYSNAPYYTIRPYLLVRESEGMDERLRMTTGGCSVAELAFTSDTVVVVVVAVNRV